MVSKAYVDKLIADLDLSGYAKTSDLGLLASKNSLAFSELTDKPTTLAGYGITDALGNNDTAKSASKLATPRKIWGQDFDGTEDITGKATFASGIIVGGGEEILGIKPEGGSYPRMRIFMHTSGLYFQAATYDGTSQNGNMQFSGMYGANAAEIHFKGDYTQFHGIAKIDGDIQGGGYGRFTKAITTHEELGILTADSQNYCARLVPIVDGAQLQVGWQDASSYNGNFYFTGMYGAALNLFNVRSIHSYFDGENVVFRNTGLTQFNAASIFNGGAKIASGQPLSFLDSNGAEHKITYDEASQAFKIDGDLFTTGETSAGGMGSELVDIEDLASRVTALETSGGMSNVNIKVTTLSLYNQQSITSTAMSSIAGLTFAIAENMVNGAYNKVVDNGGTYPKIWNYTATKSSTATMTICFSYGDGINTKESCRLDYSSSTGKWTIEMGEL